MSYLLETLKEDAVKLVEAELPSAQELRSVVGALVRRVESLERYLKSSAPTDSTEDAAPASPPPAAADVAETAEAVQTPPPPPPPAVAEPVSAESSDAPVAAEAAAAAPPPVEASQPAAEPAVWSPGSVPSS